MLLFPWVKIVLDWMNCTTAIYFLHNCCRRERNDSDSDNDANFRKSALVQLYDIWHG